jgi:hypothetical protein
MFIKYAKYSFFMLLKPLHLLGEMESTFDIIRKIGSYFCIVVGHIGAGYHFIFSRYANFSFLYALETFRPISQNGINIWY